MKNFVIDPGLCTGCTACFASCPNGSIQMIADARGFFYPVMGERCLHCGKCRAICPRISLKEGEKRSGQMAYAALSKRCDIWQKSASGGAFSEICNAWGDDNTLFCGAAWNGTAVEHISVMGVKSIAPLRKSKYLASNMKDCFSTIRDHLLGGGRALFCGTPCQVAGLRAYLGCDYEGLLLIDLICHGVGSPAVFDACLEAMEEDLGERIAGYEFRSKGRVYDSDHITKLTLHSKKNLYVTGDRYIQLFTKQDCLRDSCGANCIYRNEDRQGDITIGDFKGLREVFPHLAGSKRNYSTVVLNTKKGKGILPALQDRMQMLPCSVEDIKAHNPLFYRHTNVSKNRDAFFQAFEADAKEAIRTATLPPVRYRKNLKGRIFDLLPTGVRRKLMER